MNIQGFEYPIVICNYLDFKRTNYKSIISLDNRQLLKTFSKLLNI
jgi:hypothetical protein